MKSQQSKNSTGSVLPRTPPTDLPKAAVRGALEKILQSNAFRGSETLKRFLRYSVEQTLQGEGTELKEYRIGVEVLERGSSFDPRLDTAVRMAARRLRAKLHEYYEREGKHDAVRIDIPKGSYAATFSGSHTAASPAALSSESDSGSRDDHVLPARWRASPWLLPAIATLAVCFLAAVGIYYFASASSKPILAETDDILISDFTNITGDPVFDDTLKQAVSVQLQQSPFLNVVSDFRVRATLKLMTEPTDSKLTPEVAREVCQRAGCRLYIAGSIANLGSQFVIGLRVVDCRTGDTLAQEQVSADNKEHVLKAVDRAVARIREQVGESRRTVQRFATPLEEATTSSLEALKAFSLGNLARDKKGDAATIPFFQRALELDPNFAMAYDALGLTYSNLNEPGRAMENISKAYELRGRVSERERFEIAANYSQLVTGELEKADQICELWVHAYPRDEYPHNLLGVNYEFLGQYDRAVTETSEALRLNPEGVILHSNLMEDYTAVKRLKEAKATYRLALERRLDHPYLHADMYGIAFLEGDRAEMDRQLGWAAGQPGAEDLLLSVESDTSAFFGKVAKARNYSRQAVASALQAKEHEAAALWQMNAALREAEFGNSRLARQQTTAALAIASTRDVKILAAIALARAGDSRQAEKIADELQQRFPVNTVISRYWLPTIRAANELNENRPARAVEILQTSAQYELAYPNPQVEVGRFLYPVYLRGQAYLRMNRAAEALAEFQKFVDYDHVVENCPLGALARLGLARGYVLKKDLAKARTAYQSFLAMWKDADSEIPVFKQAHSEYDRLTSKPQ